MTNSFTLTIQDIQWYYKGYRTKGKDRATAIAMILDDYENELEDDDEKIAVLIGLSLALCKKKELTKSIADETLREIDKIRKAYDLSKTDLKYLDKTEARLKDEMNYGEEAVYKQRSNYAPDWVKGDTFYHKLSCPRAEKLGIQGWFVIFHKAGEYEDFFGQVHQLMCMTVCPPEKVPTSGKALQKLGFYPSMQGRKPEYLFQLEVKSKRAENAYELTKLGCFCDVVIPESCSSENQKTCHPLFEFKRKGEDWPVYEENICMLFKK